MKWQILIATIISRADQFELLKSELERQVSVFGLEDEVELLFDIDDREKSIGKKRQDLLEMSTAEYISYFDDDDWPHSNYIFDIHNAIQTGCDAVGILINMTTNGNNPQVCCHSSKYPKWENKKDGYDYVRNVTHFNPVKRELAIQIGFTDCRFGEDKIYSDAVTLLCKSECFVETPVFHYRYTTHIPHAEKYGIK